MNKKTVISDYMLDQNRQFHIEKPDYGANGGKWAKGVRTLIQEYNITDVLDYGCGKARLSANMPDVKFYNYDPGLPEMDQEPTPADLVVCAHILEHIEPELLHNVIDDLFLNAKKLVWITLKAGESGKILPNGRDSNLIQQSIVWWMEYLYELSPNGWKMNILNRHNFLRGMVRKEPPNDKELTCLFVNEQNVA